MVILFLLYPIYLFSFFYFFFNLYHQVAKASDRNSTNPVGSGSMTIHAGIEEKCDRVHAPDRHISAEGSDYPTRASAMLRHLTRSTGGLFSASLSVGGGSEAAEMLIPIDILSGGATKVTGAIGFSHLRLARSLKSQMENHRIDKTSLVESLKQSRVTTTKEPSEWDWER